MHPNAMCPTEPNLSFFHAAVRIQGECSQFQTHSLNALQDWLCVPHLNGTGNWWLCCTHVGVPECYSLGIFELFNRCYSAVVWSCGHACHPHHSYIGFGYAHARGTLLIFAIQNHVFSSRVHNVFPKSHNSVIFVTLVRQTKGSTAKHAITFTEENMDAIQSKQDIHTFHMSMLAAQLDTYMEHCKTCEEYTHIGIKQGSWSPMSFSI
jgi:hypothetical protein